MNSISILGCGWLGLSLGEYLVRNNYQVKGSTTRPEKLAQISALGMEAFQLSVGEKVEGERVAEFFQSDILILNIPPGRRQPDVEDRYPRQVRLIAAAAERSGIKHCIFVSSTGVYPAEGQVQIATNPTAPSTASGRALVACENYLQGLDSFSTTILRLAGLIGGERHPGRWFAGKKDLRGGQVPVNLVHRDDCIQAIEAIMVQEKWGQVYHLCADEHPLKAKYYPAMAERLGLTPPTYLEEEEGPAYKVIDNSQIVTALGLNLHYPDPLMF